MAALLLGPADRVAATDRLDRCDQLAREQSGYWSGRLFDRQFGSVRLRIGGEISIGVLRDESGVTPHIGLGRSVGEVQERERKAEYERLLRKCRSGR